MTKNVGDYLIEFLRYLKIEKKRSPKTVRNYDFYLRRFIGWFGEKKKPDGLAAENVRQYRLWLNRLQDAHGEPLKKNTQNYHLIALRSFLKYLAKRDIKTLAPEKIELMKMPDRDVSFLESVDLNRLLSAPTDNRHAADDLIKRRDKAILEMLFSTGLRVSELVGLKKNNINLNSEQFTITGKGRKARVVFLSRQAKYWLKKYIEARQDMNPFLFIAHDQKSAKGRLASGEDWENKPLTTRSVERIVQKHAKTAGIAKPVTPHTLRHSCAANLLQNGADIKSVQKILGHSSIATTQIYRNVAGKELKDIYKRYRGKNRGDS